eukprot:GHVT01002373.1.p1 GENE.GHVT01002373.1~~GHVT01002373.1.p1  ORF type:complete len:702 (-),score=55.32 GHVT01002373.1:270-2375(-)
MGEIIRGDGHPETQAETAAATCSTSASRQRGLRHHIRPPDPAVRLLVQRKFLERQQMQRRQQLLVLAVTATAAVASAAAVVYVILVHRPYSTTPMPPLRTFVEPGPVVGSMDDPCDGWRPVNNQPLEASPSRCRECVSSSLEPAKCCRHVCAAKLLTFNRRTVQKIPHKNVSRSQSPGKPWIPRVRQATDSTDGANESDTLHAGSNALPKQDLRPFTQGLFCTSSDTFIESTGLYGMSYLRSVSLHSGETVRSVALPRSYFGEGSTLVRDPITGHRLIFQLTWRNFRLLIFDHDSFNLLLDLPFSLIGWGMASSTDIRKRPSPSRIRHVSNTGGGVGSTSSHKRGGDPNNLAAPDPALNMTDPPRLWTTTGDEFLYELDLVPVLTFLRRWWATKPVCSFSSRAQSMSVPTYPSAWQPLNSAPRYLNTVTSSGSFEGGGTSVTGASCSASEMCLSQSASPATGVNCWHSDCCPVSSSPPKLPVKSRKRIWCVDRSIRALNELEFDPERNVLLANIFDSHVIIEVDPDSATCTSLISLGGLYDVSANMDKHPDSRNDVMNGVAILFDDNTDNVLRETDGTDEEEEAVDLHTTSWAPTVKSPPVLQLSSPEDREPTNKSGSLQPSAVTGIIPRLLITGKRWPFLYKVDLQNIQRPAKDHAAGTMRESQALGLSFGQITKHFIGFFDPKGLQDELPARHRTAASA